MATKTIGKKAKAPKAKKTTGNKAPKAKKAEPAATESAAPMFTGKARSPLVQAILATLAKAGDWCTREQLLTDCGNTITKAEALKVYERRIGLGEPAAVQERRGKQQVLMLACITLVGAKKIQQDGRGENKRYRLA